MMKGKSTLLINLAKIIKVRDATMKNKNKKLLCLLLSVLPGTLMGATSGYGISSWASWKPGQISRAECPELRSVPLILKWESLEREPGKYSFDEAIGKPLKAAHAEGLYLTLMIWVGPDSPEWIYEKGVPRVKTDRNVNALGKTTDKQSAYPYYLNSEYKKRFHGLIEAFGKYVMALPPDLRERIVFVQCAEGSTGDGQPYKGDPLDKKYDISADTWNQFRLEAWKKYQEAFPRKPILVNSDANGDEESKWLLDNMEVIALKQGMFSHGYIVSDNDKRLIKLENIEAEAKKIGKLVLTRGEMDAELFEMGWSNRNIPQALYWSGIFATHCRLDIWNIPYEALKDKANWPACIFFNKYAGLKDPATADFAFCALRDGLDASDFVRFPAEKFGGKPGDKKDADRYLSIAKAYAVYGASMEDVKKASGGGMENRKAKGPNDVGWGSIPDNYYRFLTQIDPGSGDVGRWNIDESIFGRFGRSFDNKTSKTQMRFQVDPRFEAKSLKMSVTYLDKGTGSWSIEVPDKTSTTVIQNTNSGTWKVKTLSLTGANELKLKYISGEDTVFHLIEVERVD